MLSAFASAPSRIESGTNRPRLIGVCSWSLRPDGPQQLVRDIRALDLRACQLALIPLATEPVRWRDSVVMLKEAGIDPVSGMLAMVGEDYSTLDSIRRTGGVALDENWPANIERAKAVADIAAEHHIPLVTFHAGFLPHDPGNPRRELMISRIKAILDVFVDRGVGVGLETGQESAKTLLEFLAEPDLHGVGVNFDPANMVLYGMGEPVDALRLLGSRVAQIHVKDAIPSTIPGEWGRETPVGEGAVDWPSFFTVAKAIGRPIDFMIEREAGELRLKEIALARDLIRRLAANAEKMESA